MPAQLPAPVPGACLPKQPLVFTGQASGQLEVAEPSEWPAGPRLLPTLFLLRLLGFRPAHPQLPSRL